MSIENKFVADLFAELRPLIDRTKRWVVIPDGQSRMAGCYGDTAVPDLCFTFRQMTDECRVEGKVLKGKGKDIQFSDLQVEQWQPGSTWPMVPHLIVVANEDLTAFWTFVHSAEIAPRLSKRINLWPYCGPPQGMTLPQLAMKIVVWVVTNLK